MIWLLALLLLLLPTSASAQVSQPGFLCENQGTLLNFAPILNCGANMTCTWSNGICTIAGTGGGGSGTVTSITGTAPITTTPSPITTTGSIGITDFVASGATHARGAVPDPGAVGGTTKFLREDATWQVPPTSGGTVTGTGASPQVAVWSGASSLTGFAGLTFTAPTLTVSGAANALEIAGSTTGNPVTISATGSDTDISVQVVPKGTGFLQIGPDTYGASGWSGYNIFAEGVILAATQPSATGLYIEVDGAPDPGFFSQAISATTLGKTGNTGSLIAIQNAAVAKTTIGNTTNALIGIQNGINNDGAGTVAYMAGIENRTVASAGTVDVSYGFYAAAYSTHSPTAIAQHYSFYANDLAAFSPLPYYFWADSRGVFRIREDSTFDSVGQAIPALYNPQFTKYTAGATNYERIVLGQWNGNVAEIGTEKGGTGTLRDLRLLGPLVSMTAASITGTAGFGYLDLVAQSSNPAAPAAGTARFHAATTQGFTRFEQDNEAATNIVLGRDTVILVQNTTASTITKGQVVYRTGVFGTVPTVGLAQANSLTTLPALGLALDDIAASAFGQIMVIGVMNTVNTLGFTATPIYVDPAVAGGFTNTRPSGTTNIVQRIGSILRVSATVGTILIDMAPALLNTETGTNAATWTASAIVGTTATLTSRSGTPATLAAFDSTGKLVESTTAATAALCPTCNAQANNPYVVPASAPTKGGLIGGAVNVINNGYNVLFGNATSPSPRMALPADMWVRRVTVNTAASQTAGAWNTYGIASNAGNADAPVFTVVGGTVSVLTGAAAGVTAGNTLARILAGNLIVLRGMAPTTAVAGVTPTGWSAEAILDDGGLVIGSHMDTAIGTSGATVYNGPFGTALLSTDAAAAGIAPFAGTLKRVCFVTTATQDASGTLVMTAMVNGSATSITASVAAGGGAGIFCDNTNTAAVAANQTVSLRFVNNATAGSQKIFNWTGELLPSSGTPAWIGGTVGAAVGTGTTAYYKPFTAVTNGTEANVRVPMARAGTHTNFCVQKSVAASAGTTTATLFKNGSASGQLTMTLDNTTGPQCTTGSVAIAASDTLTMEIKNSVSCTGGCPTLGGWSVDY